MNPALALHGEEIFGCGNVRHSKTVIKCLRISVSAPRISRTVQVICHDSYLGVLEVLVLPQPLPISAI